MATQFMGSVGSCAYLVLWIVHRAARRMIGMSKSNLRTVASYLFGLPNRCRSIKDYRLLAKTKLLFLGEDTKDLA